MNSVCDHIVLCALLALSALAASYDAAAQQFPNKPIRLIISSPAGGPRDVQARLLGPKLQDVLGQPLVVDNRGGASGIIGTDLVAKAQPDGHTLLMLTMSHAVVATLYPKLPYDSINDFTYITAVTSGPGLRWLSTISRSASSRSASSPSPRARRNSRHS